MMYRNYAEFAADVKRRKVKDGAPQEWTAEFTPAAMLECAEQQFSNRKPLRSNVKHFCNVGLMGTYSALLRNPVKFSLDAENNPRLSDGQNRFLGLGAAGKPQEVFLSVGIPRSLFANEDQGVSRTVQHVLQAEDAKNAAAAAYLVKRLDAYAQLRYVVPAKKGQASLDLIRRPVSVIDNAEVPDLFVHYRDDINAATTSKFFSKFVKDAKFRNKRELVAAKFLTDQANSLKSNEFWSLVVDQEAAAKVSATHPARWLRDALATEESAHKAAALARWGSEGLGVVEAREKLETMDAKLWQLAAAIHCYNVFVTGTAGNRTSIKPTKTGWMLEFVKGAFPSDLDVPRATETRYVNISSIQAKVDKVLERFDLNVERDDENGDDEE